MHRVDGMWSRAANFPGEWHKVKYGPILSCFYRFPQYPVSEWECGQETIKPDRLEDEV